MNRPLVDVHRDSCHSLLAQLEFQIHKADVRDAQHAMVPGYPLFRVDRLLQERLSVATTTHARLQWLSRAAAYGVSSYGFEVANLKPERRRNFPETAALQQQLHGCARASANRLQHDKAWQQFVKRIQIPSEYYLGRRVLGLYPLTNLAMKAGIKKWQAGTQQYYAQPLEASAAHQLWQLEPLADKPAEDMVKNLLGEAAQKLGPLGKISYDVLGMPDPSEAQWQSMARRFAPQWMLEQRADYDQPGRPMPEGQFTAAPVVYWQAGVGKVHGQLLPQISYFMWFSERPKTGALDILGGKLDGVVWRVTLSPEDAEAGTDWRPLIYDSIHPCGCYHLFFPTPRLQHCAVDDSRETAFVPQAAPQGPFVVWLQSATHYVERLQAPSQNQPAKHYRLLPLDDLRRAVDGKRLYGSNGLVNESRRLERVLLWTSGLESPGAMRQWGSHATAFSGQRYFDEPGLFDKEFCLPEAAAVQGEE